MRLKCLLWVAVFVWAFAAYANVEVSVSKPGLQAGYFRTLVFQLSNRGNTEVRGKIHIDFKNNSRWTREFTLATQSSAPIRVVFPAKIAEFSPEISVQLGGSIIWSDSYFPMEGSRGKNLLYSNDLPETLVCKVFGIEAKGYGIAPLAPNEISADETDLLGIHKIVLSADIWHDLPADRRGSLLKYAAAGGILVLLDPAAKPQSQALGLGLVMTLNPESPDDDMLHSIDSFERWDDWSPAFDFETPARQLNIHVVFFIMLAVSLLIGPGVYFYCSRRKKLVHTVWLIPALSLGFALLLIVYIGWSEGWQATGKAQNKIFLDLPGKTAYCFSANGYFSSVFPPGDLVVFTGTRFDSDTTSQSRSRRGEAGFDVYDDGLKQYWGNFLQSRTKNLVNTFTRAELPDYFEFRRLSPERILVVSSYPAALRNFELIDEAGFTYAAKEVMPGSQTEISKTAAVPCQTEFSASDFYHNQPFRLGFRAEAAARVFAPGIWVKTDRFTESTEITGRIGGIK